MCVIDREREENSMKQKIILKLKESLDKERNKRDTVCIYTAFSENLIIKQEIVRKKGKIVTN